MQTTSAWTRAIGWGLAVLSTYGLLGGLLGCGPSPQLRAKANEQYRVAQQYLGNQSYILAEQEIRKALALSPQEPRYFELLALIHQADGRLKHADEAYRAALQQPDAPPSVLVNYSSLLLQRERYDKAIAFAQQALQDPQYGKQALAHTNIGLAYFKKGAFLKAEAHFRSALDYQSSLAEAHHNLGLVYARSGKRAPAILSFREAIRFQPAYTEAYASLGQLLAQDGHTDEARDAFERVIDLSPNSDLAVASRRQLKRLAP